MAPWRIRDFHDDDLDAAIRLWEDRAAGTAAPVFGLSDPIATVRAGAPAVVAVVGEDLVGSAVATISGAQAGLMRISLAPAWRKRGIGSAMLTELEEPATGARRDHPPAGRTGQLPTPHAGTRAGPQRRLEVDPAGADAEHEIGRSGATVKLSGPMRNANPSWYQLVKR